MPSLTDFCEWMRKACEDWSLGYDQANRWDVRDGGECDCSSLVIWALRKAGFDTGSASYTGDMSSQLTRHGWVRYPYRGLSDVRAGDILLNDKYHVAAVISGSGITARLAQASIDERGKATGGASGDQSGSETNTRQVYEYWAGWDCILRYSGGDAGAAPASGSGTSRLDVDGVIGPITVKEWQTQCGTTVDSVISGQMAALADYFPAIVAIEYDSGGSELIREVQARVGVPNPTGIAARGTICHLQGWLVLEGYDIGSDEAGVLDEGTAKALQRSLNDGRWKA